MWAMHSSTHQHFVTRQVNCPLLSAAPSATLRCRCSSLLESIRCLPSTLQHAIGPVDETPAPTNGLSASDGKSEHQGGLQTHDQATPGDTQETKFLDSDQDHESATSSCNRFPAAGADTETSNAADDSAKAHVSQRSHQQSQTEDAQSEQQNSEGNEENMPQHEGMDNNEFASSAPHTYETEADASAGRSANEASVPTSAETCGAADNSSDCIGPSQSPQAAQSEQNPKAADNSLLDTSRHEGKTSAEGTASANCFFDTPEAKDSEASPLNPSPAHNTTTTNSVHTFTCTSGNHHENEKGTDEIGCEFGASLSTPMLELQVVRQDVNNMPAAWNGAETLAAHDDVLPVLSVETRIPVPLAHELKWLIWNQICFSIHNRLCRGTPVLL